MTLTSPIMIIALISKKINKIFRRQLWQTKEMRDWTHLRPTKK